MRATPGAVDVGLSTKGQKPELEVTINRGLAGTLGVSVGQIAQALRPAFAGVDAGNWVDPTGETRYVARAARPPRCATSPADLAAASRSCCRRGPERRAVVVPLGQVATITASAGPAQIDHLDRSRVVTVGANVEGVDRQRDAAPCSGASRRCTLPAGLSRSTLGGQAKDQAEVFGPIFTALGVAVMLMYLILVVQFGSRSSIRWRSSSSLPLSLIGVRARAARSRATR